MYEECGMYEDAIHKENMRRMSRSSCEREEEGTGREGDGGR